MKIDMSYWGGTELVRLPRVWERLGIQLSVAQHLFELGVVEGAVDGKVDIAVSWRQTPFGP